MKNLKEMKICKKCLVEKPLTEFHTRKDGKLGSRTHCKQCTSMSRKDYYFKRGGKEKQAKRSFSFNLKKYDLTLEEYNKLFEEQNGRCYICLSTESHRTKTRYKLVVDHCHTTGKVRGLLCHHCNVGLGHFKDNTDLLKKAIEYLNENNSGH
jgi:hypothetical protein